MNIIFIINADQQDQEESDETSKWRDQNKRKHFSSIA